MTNIHFQKCRIIFVFLTVLVLVMFAGKTVPAQPSLENMVYDKYKQAEMDDWIKENYPFGKLFNVDIKPSTAFRNQKFGQCRGEAIFAEVLKEFIKKELLISSRSSSQNISIVGDIDFYTSSSKTCLKLTFYENEKKKEIEFKAPEYNDLIRSITGLDEFETGPEQSKGNDPPQKVINLIDNGVIGKDVFPQKNFLVKIRSKQQDGSWKVKRLDRTTTFRKKDHKDKYEYECVFSIGEIFTIEIETQKENLGVVDLRLDGISSLHQHKECSYYSLKEKRVYRIDGWRSSIGGQDTIVPFKIERYGDGNTEAERVGTSDGIGTIELLFYAIIPDGTLGQDTGKNLGAIGGDQANAYKVKSVIDHVRIKEDAAIEHIIIRYNISEE